jgi:hypothetical protein
VKAMLTSPGCDANGFSNTFTGTDIHSMKSGGSNRAQATEAANLMKEAETFLTAYGRRIDSATIQKLLNTLEVRLVMTVHKKTCTTRASFSSLQQVAASFYADAKEKDNLLPKWNMLTEEVTDSKSTSKIAVLRETGDIVTESLLAEKGFEVGKQVVCVESGNIFMLSALNADATTVTLKLEEKVGKGKVKTPATVDRAELLLGEKWQPCNVNKIIFFDSKLPDPTVHFDLKASIMSGLFKQAIAVEFNKSSYDADCKMSMSSDGLRVYANTQFKTGAFKLVGLSNNIIVAPADKVMLAAGKTIGSGKDWKALARSSNSPLTRNSKPDYFVCYWAVQSTFEQAAVNCKFVDKTVEISVLGDKYELSIPMLVNTAPIAKDDEIIALRESQPEPTNKRRAGAARPAAVKKIKK